ncbi:gamma-tubulin complex component 2 [Sorghum bicolor]|nr:gamma-tubulin complex component 2 [Sorghum bicolor]|eukprot:XP_021319294.1 gamma-tubulin complex component 2 [Sorghum bicolor]
MDPAPATPRWNLERPYLTGRFHQEAKAAAAAQGPGSKSFSLESFSRGAGAGTGSVIGSYAVSVQELLVIDDLLSALVGIEGRYISIKRVRGKEGYVVFQIDSSMDLALQELTRRIFPLCEDYVLVSQFVESRSHFKNGLVNHALAAALRAFLLDYQAMVAQLEHQFRLGRLSVQGLWFFCQRMMSSLNALAVLVEKATSNNTNGSATLNLLQSQAKAMGGDSAVRSLLEKMTEYASGAYLRMLERWVYEGLIDDPYGEFFIAENKSLQKESLTQDYDAKYWQQRYSLKEGIPSFLTNVAAMILTTGKYLNVMRECGHNVQVSLSDNTKLMSFGSNHQYLECIKSAYDFASGELLTLMKDKYDLIGKLRSLKRYLLLDQGDFLVHFMDIAREELTKKPEEISAEKLQSLLDIALRSTAAASDPSHEELICCVERSSLLKKLGTLKDLDCAYPADKLAAADVDQSMQLSITGLETFCLSNKVQWPLSLVISRKALTKYQLIFRLLFHCKHVSRQLCAAWQIQQVFRSVKILGTPILRSSILCRSMLKFVNSLLHYLTFEVLEPNWHLMHDRLQTARSIDEVIQIHDFFLQKCLKECLLLSPELLVKIEKLKGLCLQYATSIQLLMPSIDVTNSENTSKSGKSRSRINKSQDRDQQLKLASENVVMSESILKFEAAFNSELQSLAPTLSNSSHAEPYLTHLAQCILGVRIDQAHAERLREERSRPRGDLPTNPHCARAHGRGSMVGGGGRRAATAAALGRWCLVILAVASALGVSGPAFYWRYKKGFSSSSSSPASTAAVAASSPSCPPCSCDCPAPLSLKSIAPGLANFSITDCGKNNPELAKEMEKQFVDLLNEELKLQQVVAEEHSHHMNATLVEAKRQATQYQREAEKCNAATETCEEAREQSEAAISKEKKLTAMWEQRARQLGWQDSRATSM